MPPLYLAKILSGHRRHVIAGVIGLQRDRRGAAGMLVAFAAPVILGFAALGVESGLWFVEKRELQTIADGAALGAAYGIGTGADTADLIDTATTDAVRNGYSAAGGDSLTLNSPPTTGSYAADTASVEVEITRPQVSLLSGVLGTGTLVIRARAVAQSKGSFGNCFLALNKTAADSVLLVNNASLPKSCGVAVNSSSASALHLQNNAKVLGASTVVGNYKTENNASVATVATGAAATADPYSGVDPGTAGTCSPTPCSSNANKTVSLSPGTYCSGCSFANNSTVNLAAGTYYVKSALSMTNNVTVNGSGVTFVLENGATLNLGNNAKVNIDAPTSGATAGIAFMTRSTAPSGDINLQNNVHLNVNGAFYFPNQRLVVQNNSNTAGNCTQFVADRLYFQNNADLDVQCSGTGVKSIGSGAVALVE